MPSNYFRNFGLDWLIAKIWLPKLRQAKILAAIWLATKICQHLNWHSKFMANILCLSFGNFFLPNLWYGNFW
jgi:hypothetical protein